MEPRADMALKSKQGRGFCGEQGWQGQHQGALQSTKNAADSPRDVEIGMRLQRKQLSL